MIRTGLIYLSILMISFQVSARPNILSHGQFVHLSDSQKNDYVIKLMELAVELESKYQHDVKVSGYNFERYLHYSKLMREISSFFIDSALAASNSSVSWETHAKNFASILTSGGDQKCIYAGWPSQVRVASVPSKEGVTRREICIHPKFLAKGAPEREAYQDSDNCGGGRDTITCNPAIFGYKNASEQSVFCVKAGINDSENSSLSCMQVALNPGEGADTKDARLQFLREKLIKDPKVFDSVQKFVAKTCVCLDSESSINKNYLSKIRPHRTCYGLMEMTANTIICETPGLPKDASIFQNILNFTSEKNISPAVSPEDVDLFYQSYLKTLESTDDYKKLCGGIVAPVATPKAATTTAQDKAKEEVAPTPEASYQCVKAICTKKTAREDAATTKPEVAPKDTSPYTCEYQISEKKTPETFITPDSLTADIPATEEAPTTISVKAVIGKKEHVLSCNVEDAPEETEPPKAEDGIKPTLTIVLGNKTQESIEVKAEVENKGDYKIVWYRKNFPSEDKTKKKAEEKEDKVKAKKKEVSPIAGDEEEAPAEKKKEEKIAKTEGEISGSLDKTKILEPLKNESYKTCAKLVKGSEQIEGNCVDIPKLGSTPQVQGQGQQPMQIPRPSSSTSAMGIR